jgi:hypothetical protein
VPELLLAELIAAFSPWLMVTHPRVLHRFLCHTDDRLVSGLGSSRCNSPLSPTQVPELLFAELIAAFSPWLTVVAIYYNFGLVAALTDYWVTVNNLYIILTFNVGLHHEFAPDETPLPDGRRRVSLSSRGREGGVRVLEAEYFWEGHGHGLGHVERAVTRVFTRWKCHDIGGVYHSGWWDAGCPCTGTPGR